MMKVYELSESDKEKYRKIFELLIEDTHLQFEFFTKYFIVGLNSVFLSFLSLSIVLLEAQD